MSYAKASDDTTGSDFSAVDELDVDRDAAAAQVLCLLDGAPIIVRPIRPDDAAELARAYARLSERSRRRRFLSVADPLPTAELRYLTSVDHDSQQALVAIDANSGAIVGSARYWRLPGRSGDAELALEVIDDWQRRGVGRTLLEALTVLARVNGVERFIAIVSAENGPAQRGLQRAGARCEAYGGDVEYELDVEALARLAAQRETLSRACCSGRQGRSNALCRRG